MNVGLESPLRPVVGHCMCCTQVLQDPCNTIASADCICCTVTHHVASHYCTLRRVCGSCVSQAFLLVVYFRSA